MGRGTTLETLDLDLVVVLLGRCNYTRLLVHHSVEQHGLTQHREEQELARPLKRKLSYVMLM